jgi:inner membrane protein
MVTPMAWGVIGVVTMSTFPDIDLYGSVLTHRGLSHSWLMALFVGVWFAGAGYLLATAGVGTSAGVSTVQLQSGRLAVFAGAGYGFFVGAFSVGGHLLGDSFTPMGVSPWEPVSDRRHSLEWFNARNSVANTGLFVLGVPFLGAGVVLGTLFRAGVLVVRVPPLF